MDIQSIFYLLASIFMILGIVVMIAILLFIWYLKTSADSFQKKVKEHINDVLTARKFAGIVPLVGTIIKWMAQRRKRQTS